MKILNEKAIETIAEEMRIRHYIKYIGFTPTTPFSDLVGDRSMLIRLTHPSKSSRI